MKWCESGDGSRVAQTAGLVEQRRGVKIRDRPKHQISPGFSSANRGALFFGPARGLSHVLINPQQQPAFHRTLIFARGREPDRRKARACGLDPVAGDGSVSRTDLDDLAVFIDTEPQQ